MIITDINGAKRECIKVALDKGYPGYIRVDYKSKNRKGHTHSEWLPVNEFLKLNPDFKEKIKEPQDVAEEDLGIVSSSGKNFFRDSTKKWKKNLYAGYPVWISRGLGEGQQRTVTKNTQNAIYVDKEWEIKPDKTSQYVLSRNVKNNIAAMGNTLPDLKTKEMLEDLVKKAKKGAIITN